MSLCMSIDPDYYYLCDGVYWNWDLENNTDIREEEPLTSSYENRFTDEISFSKKFSSSEAYRAHHFFEVLSSNMRYAANRYCQYESLSKDYAEVAMQKNILKDIVFVHATALGLNLALNYIKTLDEIVLNTYKNKKHNSVYNRVAVLQLFIHKCTLEEGKRIEHLDREMMRKFLSLCRLHIAISDIRKKNINFIKDELVQNFLEAKENPPINYITMLNRKHIQNWKKRHLKSLLHFYKPKERKILKRLINLKQPFSNTEVQEVIFEKYKW